VTGTVVVVGASGYIGNGLVRRLLEDEHRVVGISRRPAVAQMLLPEQSDGFAIATPEDAGSLIAGEPVSIVNLAFVKGALPHWIHRQNRRLVRSIAQLAATGRCRRLVHLSTAAVFGYTLAEPPSPVRLRRPPRDLYAEQKLHAEHMIERLGRKLGREFGIVRLGNVIGPGSPIWVAGLGQRVMEVKPVGYEGERGFSNTTHVENVADYIAHLIGQPAGALPEFGPYHHLAEFSSHRWPELLDVISDAIGPAWTTVPRPQTSARRRAPSLKRILKAPYAATPADRHIRVGMGLLPEWEIFDRLIARVREPPPPELDAGGDRVGLEDVGLLEVLSAAHEFASWTLEGWNPKLNFDSACAGIADWLRMSAYELRPPLPGSDDPGPESRRR
jgi:nucleoside-diphosphate-sugar epimerase